MKITQDLSRSWLRIIVENLLMNEFTAPDDDPAGQWLRGDRIRAGLAFNLGKIEYYAWNLTRECEIKAKVEEDTRGRYCVQRNDYRALKGGSVPAESGCCGFYHGDPSKPLSIENRQELAQIRLTNHTWNVLPNASPFDKRGHVLFVPTDTNSRSAKYRHYPQKLTREFLEDMLLLARCSEGLLIFWNSIGAGASVDGAHGQGVYCEDTLPIEKVEPVTYRGYSVLLGCAAKAISFNLDFETEKIVETLDRLNSENIPFNLILGKRAYLVPRRGQKATAGLVGTTIAAMELAGKLILIGQEAYESATEAAIEAAIESVCINPTDLIDRWRR